jgi:DNA (cytosine-5)-methyltransferase 1
VDNTKQSPTLLSLCSGYGGIEEGIRRAIGAVRVLAHVEIEAYAIANLLSKMESEQVASAPIWTNLKTLPTRSFRESVDILTGGYPCQPFSAAGKRLGTEDPRHLFPHILRIIDEVMPRMCFFENVEGHVSLGLREVLESLEERGYKTAWGIFSAEEVGAPHRRKRVFIMAQSNSSRLCGGWYSEECTDDDNRIQSNKGERNELRSEVEGCNIISRRELADTNTGRSEWGNEAQSDQVGEVEQYSTQGEVSVDGGELAHTNCRGSGEDIEQTKPRTVGIEQPPRSSWGGAGQGEAKQVQRWPARPSENQHDWEEPRTVERKMGGTVNGPSNRVDELRQLGNGVVPQTAELAFKILSERIKWK